MQRQADTGRKHRAEQGRKPSPGPQTQLGYSEKTVRVYETCRECCLDAIYADVSPLFLWFYVVKSPLWRTWSITLLPSWAKRARLQQHLKKTSKRTTSYLVSASASLPFPAKEEEGGGEKRITVVVSQSRKEAVKSRRRRRLVSASSFGS